MTLYELRQRRARLTTDREGLGKELVPSRERE